MPQLDVVSCFNQVIWLAVVFILLLTSFYYFLLRPYNKAMLVRKSLVTLFNLLSISLSFPTVTAAGVSLDRKLSLLTRGSFLESTISRSFGDLVAKVKVVGDFKTSLFVTTINILLSKNAS